MFREVLKLLSRDNLQVQALSECYEMLDLSHRMVKAAVESLRQRDDAEMDVDIYEMDRRLNSFERDVRRKVMTHLSLGHTGDLASGLVLVSVVIDIERIGDYSKNIGDLARNHPERLIAGQDEEALQAIESHAFDYFGRTVRTFKAADIDEARKLMTDYKEEISRHCDDLVDKVVRGETDLSAGEAAATALYTRFLKRISAHSRNLVSSLVNPFDRIGYPE